MALPLLLPVLGSGFTALGSGIVGAILGVISFIAALVGKRAAFVIFSLVVFSGATIIFSAAIVAIFNAVAVPVIPEWLISGFSLFMPSNVDECISAILAAKVVSWLFAWKRYFILSMSYV